MRYIGVEQIPELLEIARERFKHLPNCDFYQLNFMRDELPEADYIIACGALSYRSSDPQFVCKAIKKLYDSSTKGIGFNLLSQIAGKGLLVAYNAEEILTYCKTLSADVILKREYSEEDFTILMYKSRSK